ncbi:MAG: plastocyanin/azurin family copper-binding protein, partial [Actinomycetota bacterium]
MRRTCIGPVIALAIAVGAVAATPQPAVAASAEVAVKDNRFEPREIRIDPGDTVTWTNQGSRVHDLKADDGAFRSGDMRQGDRFSHTFRDEGYYFYHCTYHGSKGRVGMWGVVIVGDPPPPPEPLRTRKSRRPQLVVPDEFATIQAAVDHARAGTTVVVKPGTYRESVVVTTSRLVIRGVDRFRTVLNGSDRMNNGIIVDGANDVTVKNMTVRNYTSNGIYFNNSDGYTMSRIDAINNRVYGLYAFDSYEGIIRDSFTWGSGDAGVYIGECMGCAAVVKNLHAEWNLLGYSGTNATGVAITNSTFVNNAVGI